LDTCLIIGNGRAGKRHAKYAAHYGMKVYTVDPNLEADYTCLEDALYSDTLFDCMVIATPPDSHLKYIQKAIRMDMPAICEKPLCDLSNSVTAKSLADMADEAQVMVAYNWRYHPAIIHAMADVDTEKYGKVVAYNIHARHYRPDLPTWGVLLDHVSHDVDTINCLSGGINWITSAVHEKIEDDHDAYRIKGITNSECQFSILEYAEMGHTIERNTYLEIVYENGSQEYQLTPDDSMFHSMWKTFLNGVHYPNLMDAYKTQQVLWAINNYWAGI